MKRLIGDIKKTKVRFNAVDLVIIAVVLFALFNVITAFVFADGGDKEYRMTIALDAEEARQMDLAGITAKSGSEVLLLSKDGCASPKETAPETIVIGRLEKDRAKGETFLGVIIDDETLETANFEYGIPTGIKIGQLFSRNAVIKSIEEVSGQ